MTPNNKKHNKTDEVFAAMEKELNTNENKTKQYMKRITFLRFMKIMDLAVLILQS